MKASFYIILCFIGLLFPFYGSSQKITGTWEGIMDDEVLQVNIKQNGNRICGYSYDYMIGNKESYCKAYFEGYYDKSQEIWFIDGTRFYENQGEHVLMRMKFWADKSSGTLLLRGSVSLKSSLGSFLGLSSAMPVTLRRVSPIPQYIPGTFSPCYDPVPQKKPDPEKPALPKPVQPKPVPPKPPKPELPKKDTQKISSIDSLQLEPVKKPDVKPLEDNRLLSRKNKEMKRLIVNVKNINLKVYDNGTIDNDTVSIYYNGRLIVNKQRLSETAINVNIELDENAPLHKITMFAENLGSIPPNTALVVVTAGKKRFELFSSASLEENAVLVFEYVPD